MRVGYLIDKRENPKGVVPLRVFFILENRSQEIPQQNILKIIRLYFCLI